MLYFGCHCQASKLEAAYVALAQGSLSWAPLPTYKCNNPPLPKPA